MKPELITIGSCTLDCIIQIDDILRFELLDKHTIKKYTAVEYSRKMNVDNVRFVPGGSAANIASNCAMLGLTTAYLGVLGKDFSAQICMDDMKKRGVDLSDILQTDKDSTAFSVILKTEWGKDRSILAYKGANNLLKPENIKEELFDNIKALVWTSLTNEEACKAIDKAIDITKKKGGKVFAAPSMSILSHNRKWAKILISKSDVLSLNKEEAKEITKKEESLDMLKKLHNWGIKLVSLTDGQNGSILFDGENILNSSIFEGPVEDTTGAGDAFMSGILISTLNNFSLKKTARIAAAMSHLECKTMGVRVGLPTNLQELEKFIEANNIKQTETKLVKTTDD
ncbi:MAG: carbohydrate kinase family protein [Candidatus Lokiarchaeota archaeon]|nr:carbohydrate kinase family protein [Candidatus Lokiarchaeota archaeon]